MRLIACLDLAPGPRRRYTRSRDKLFSAISTAYLWVAAEAEGALGSLRSSVAITVKKYKEKISQAREALKERFLTRLEAQHIRSQ